MLQCDKVIRIAHCPESPRWHIASVQRDAAASGRFIKGLQL
jgi:hypothetical protein